MPPALGLDPAAFGFLTSAAARGASIFKMADQSRHRSMDTLRGYVRYAEIFKDHARAGLLLRDRIRQMMTRKALTRKALGPVQEFLNRGTGRGFPV
jgi:hypothetical protein